MSNQKSKSKAQGKKQKSNSVWLWVGLAVVLLLVVGAGLLLRGGTNSASTSLPAEIDVAQAAKMRAAGAFILDVREPSEWQQNHIPGATLIPLGELASRVSEVPQDREVVVVCRSGNRSQQGRDILRNAGLPQVTSMTGGMNQWMASGYEWVSGQ
jgi:rhodanese-related sulfurtransferase